MYSIHTLEYMPVAMWDNTPIITAHLSSR